MDVRRLNDMGGKEIIKAASRTGDIGLRGKCRLVNQTLNSFGVLDARLFG